MLTIPNFLFLLFLSIINPVAWGAWIATLIAWFVPWEYLGLWITSVVGIWSIFLFPFNRPYVDVHFDFSEIIIYSANLALFIGMVGVIVTRLRENHHKHRERSAINKRGKFLSSVSYGILAAYFSYLFLTDLWHGYQPAWQAYSVILIGAFCAIVFTLFQTYRDEHIRDWIKDLFTSIYSFAAATIAIFLSNLIFPILAIEETKKVIEHHGDRNLKHCIQSDRKPLETWLYLSPLTAWNKPNGNFLGGAGLRHAVLVIDKNNEYILYHWSYKLRKWEFTSVGFEPGAFTVPDSLQCTPKKDYWRNLPFLFPEGKL